MQINHTKAADFTTRANNGEVVQINKDTWVSLGATLLALASPVVGAAVSVKFKLPGEPEDLFLLGDEGYIERTTFNTIRLILDTQSRREGASNARFAY